MSVEIHVVPTSDHVDHSTTDPCICGPDAQEEPTGVVVVHHSLDNRESIE